GLFESVLSLRNSSVTAGRRFPTVGHCVSVITLHGFQDATSVGGAAAPGHRARVHSARPIVCGQRLSEIVPWSNHGYFSGPAANIGCNSKCKGSQTTDSSCAWANFVHIDKPLRWGGCCHQPFRCWKALCKIAQLFSKSTTSAQLPGLRQPIVDPAETSSAFCNPGFGARQWKHAGVLSPGSTTGGALFRGDRCHKEVFSRPG